MATSSIEWTELTWNPTTGCDKISAGCKFCYAEIMSRRLKAMVFVNSMSDLFHKDVPLDFIQRVFAVMKDNDHLIFQVLTKRAERLAELRDELEWSPNIWMGVSVENALVKDRIDHMRKVPAAVRFLSCEPLIGPLPKLNLRGIHWVIVGGESGASPRPMRPEWVRDIRDQCAAKDVAFFFKQWGGRNKKAAGRELDARVHDGFPNGSSPRNA
jgi:protein gp37